MTDGLEKLNAFIEESADGNAAKAAAMLGYSNAYIYAIRAGRMNASHELLARIENGSGDRAVRVNGEKQFDINADFSTMEADDIARHMAVIEHRLEINQKIIETEMEKAKQRVEASHRLVPVLMEAGRKAVAEMSKRQMAKFGIAKHNAGSVVSDELRTAIINDSDQTSVVAGRYGVSDTTVRRIRREARALAESHPA